MSTIEKSLRLFSYKTSLTAKPKAPTIAPARIFSAAFEVAVDAAAEVPVAALAEAPVAALEEVLVAAIEAPGGLVEEVPVPEFPAEVVASEDVMEGVPLRLEVVAILVAVSSGVPVPV